MIQIRITYDPRHETGLITLEDMQRPSCDAICHQLANLLYTYQKAAQPGQKEFA